MGENSPGGRSRPRVFEQLTPLANRFGALQDERQCFKKHAERFGVTVIHQRRLDGRFNGLPCLGKRAACFPKEGPTLLLVQGNRGAIDLLTVVQQTLDLNGGFRPQAVQGLLGGGPEPGSLPIQQDHADWADVRGGDGEATYPRS